MTANQFRKLALALPEATEASHQNHPDFRVAGKIFATLGPENDWAMVFTLREGCSDIDRDCPEHPIGSCVGHDEYLWRRTGGLLGDDATVPISDDVWCLLRRPGERDAQDAAVELGLHLVRIGPVGQPEGGLEAAGRSGLAWGASAPGATGADEGVCVGTAGSRPYKRMLRSTSCMMLMVASVSLLVETR